MSCPEIIKCNGPIACPACVTALRARLADVERERAKQASDMPCGHPYAYRIEVLAVPGDERTGTTDCIGCCATAAEALAADAISGVDQQRARAEKAEARVRELELCCDTHDQRYAAALDEATEGWMQENAKERARAEQAAARIAALEAALGEVRQVHCITSGPLPCTCAVCERIDTLLTSPATTAGEGCGATEYQQRARAEKAEARVREMGGWLLRIAQAAGIVYEADGLPDEPGDVDSIVRAIETDRRYADARHEAESRADEWERCAREVQQWNERQRARIAALEAALGEIEQVSTLQAARRIARALLTSPATTTEPVTIDGMAGERCGIGCPHPPHLGACTRRSGGTANPCPCIRSTLPTPASEQHPAYCVCQMCEQRKKLAPPTPAPELGGEGCSSTKETP